MPRSGFQAQVVQMSQFGGALILGAVWYSKMLRGNQMFSTRTANTQHWTQHVTLCFIGGLLLSSVVVLIYSQTKWYLPLVMMLLSLAMSLNGLTRRILITLTLLVGFLLAVCVFTPALQPVQRFLDVTQLPSRADVIVILGGGLHCGSTDLESSSLARTTKGLALWKAGYAPTITISDTTGSSRRTPQKSWCCLGCKTPAWKPRRLPKKPKNGVGKPF
jgi:hypothetical protein